MNAVMCLRSIWPPMRLIKWQLINHISVSVSHLLPFYRVRLMLLKMQSWKFNGCDFQRLIQSLFFLFCVFFRTHPKQCKINAFVFNGKEERKTKTHLMLINVCNLITPKADFFFAWSNGRETDKSKLTLFLLFLLFCPLFWLAKIVSQTIKHCDHLLNCTQYKTQTGVKSQMTYQICF